MGKKETDYDVVVIGAGSAGLTAAIGGAGIGAKVLLVEKEKVGGDCTYSGCVPSKTLIKAGKIAKTLKNYEKFGVETDLVGDLHFKLKTSLDKVQEVVSGIAEHESPVAIKKYGVDVEIGEAKFKDSKTLIVNKKEITAKKFIIATGARARIPPIRGLDRIKYMTNKEIFDPQSFSSLTILGGGPIACELALAFSNLGIEVHLINTAKHLLGREDKEASQIIEKAMHASQVRVYSETQLIEVTTKGAKKYFVMQDQNTKKRSSLETDELLVAVGREPNVDGLGLDEAGIEYDEKGIKVDAYGRTSVKNIFAIGDVLGQMQFTHLANQHAKAILSTVLFHFPAKLETRVVPRVTFTEPEIASIGIREDEKEESDLVLYKKMTEVDRAVTESETQGFFKIIVDKKGLIKGACLVGQNSGELIGELAFAMKQKIPITKLADTIHPYPTFGYGLRHTADQFRAMKYTENKKKWVKKIFALRG